MTDAERLAAIERRLNDASAMPWTPFHAIVLTPDSVTYPGWRIECNRDADATFIAHAREDIPWLLTKVRVQEAVLNPGRKR